MWKVTITTDRGEVSYEYLSYREAWEARDRAHDMGLHLVRVERVDGGCPHCDGRGDTCTGV